MIDVSVVVVTFREQQHILKSCFDSVYRQTDVTCELIIVDNGSSDETKQLVESYEGAQYIRNKENRGFAAAVNQGMAVAKGKYVLLLNPDTYFENGTFEKVVQHLDVNQEVGIASTIIRYPDGSLQESIRRFPTLLDQLLILFKIPHFVKENRFIDRYMYRDVDPTQTRDVDSIMGAFMWIRKGVVRDIGLFDERYFIWFEEVDYCKMASDAGWKIRHYADVEIVHHKGLTFGKIATLKKQKWVRQSLRKYMYKHEGWLSALVLWILTPVFILIALAAALVKRK